MATNKYSQQAAVNGLHVMGGYAAPDIWGMSPETRLRKQISRLELVIDGQLLLRGDVVYEDTVLKGLIERPNTALSEANGERLGIHLTTEKAEEGEAWLTQGGALPEGIEAIMPEGLGLAYNRTLRKRAVPKCYVVAPSTVRAIEWDLYKASYKGVTDLVTKYVWPVPAFHATRFCARFGLSPNMVTSIGAVLMVAAFILFYQGHYGWGLLAGWIMTFLDTVDGKLARCTLTSSKWGNIFDHGIDLFHPPFWYLAWGLGLAAAGFPNIPWIGAGIVIIFAAYVGGRLCEGYFIRRFGFHIHVWRRFDSFFRTIVARRNPNMILLTLSWMLGRPDIGFLLVVLWTLASVPVHLVQIAQAEKARSEGQTLTS